MVQIDPLKDALFFAKEKNSKHTNFLKNRVFLTLQRKPHKHQEHKAPFDPIGSFATAQWFYRIEGQRRERKPNEYSHYNRLLCHA